jgi:hypothetical protein
MNSQRILRVLRGMIVLAVPVALGGCAARVYTPVPEPPPPPEPVFQAGVTFAPLYFNGYVVYYDEWGAPYYVDRGHRHYVPRGHAHYDTYVRHYHRQPQAYRRWERRYYPGHRYEPGRRPSRRTRIERYHR